MKHRRRELLEQMVLKKERKMKDKIREADFALHASTETVKAGMYQAYYDEEKLRAKDKYARDLKKQMVSGTGFCCGVVCVVYWNDALNCSNATKHCIHQFCQSRQMEHNKIGIIFIDGPMC